MTLKYLKHFYFVFTPSAVLHNVNEMTVFQTLHKDLHSKYEMRFLWLETFTDKHAKKKQTLRYTLSKCEFFVKTSEHCNYYQIYFNAR